jgi:hypothetical protein
VRADNPDEPALKATRRRADAYGMVDPELVLERLFARYRSALAANRSSAAGRNLATAEAVLEARVCLYEHLVAHGRDAPREVRHQLAFDALLLEQPPSVLAG